MAHHIHFHSANDDDVYELGAKKTRAKKILNEWVYTTNESTVKVVLSNTSIAAETVLLSDLANVTNKILYGNSVINSLTVSTINGQVYTGPLGTTASFSTLTVSSLASLSAGISNINVSSINGQVYISTFPTIASFSTLTVSSIVSQSSRVSSLACLSAGINSLTISSINGQEYTPGGAIGNTASFSTLTVSSLACLSSGISSLNVSSINGQVYTPGGAIGNTASFSTLTVSSITSLSSKVSSLTVSSLIVSNSLFSSISTLGLLTTNIYCQFAPTSTLTLTAKLFSTLIGMS